MPPVRRSHLIQVTQCAARQEQYVQRTTRNLTRNRRRAMRSVLGAGEDDTAGQCQSKQRQERAGAPEAHPPILAEPLDRTAGPTTRRST